MTTATQADAEGPSPAPTMKNEEGYGTGTGGAHDGGLRALCSIAAYFRIAAHPGHLSRELALGERPAGPDEIVRAAAIVGLRARIVRNPSAKRLASVPVPALMRRRDATFVVFGGASGPGGLLRIVDPATRQISDASVQDVMTAVEPFVILVGRRRGGLGLDPKSFS